jgi:hypothetical protein
VHEAKDPSSEFFMSKTTRKQARGLQSIYTQEEFFSLSKTLQLFVPNSKRLGGYTQ